MTELTHEQWRGVRLNGGAGGRWGTAQGFYSALETFQTLNHQTAFHPHFSPHTHKTTLIDALEPYGTLKVNKRTYEERERKKKRFKKTHV